MQDAMTHQNQPVAVFGASGTVGQYVADQLRGAGAAVRTIGRGASSDFETDWSLESLTQALSGCQSAFLMVPLVENARQLGLTCGRALEAAGIDSAVRLSVLSGLMTAETRLGTLHAELDAQLAAILPETNGVVRHTSLRPDSFMENLLMARFEFATEHGGRMSYATGRGRFAMIAARDIAACACAVLLGHTPHRGAIDVTGPDAIDYADIAAALTAALSADLGHPIRENPITLAEFESSSKAAGLPPFLVNMLTEVTAWTRAEPNPETTDAVLEMTGTAPIKLQDWIDQHRKALLQGV